MNGKTVFLVGLDKPTSHVGKVIAWFTWGKYSHAKTMFILPDGQRRVFESRFGCGVIERDHDPDHEDFHTEWFIVDLPRPEAALLFARKQVGKRYDNPMWKHLFRPSRETRKRSGMWYCSEYAYQQAIEGGVWLLRILESFKISPSLLGASPLLHGPVIVPEA
jgi:hypothetical protein